MRTPVLADPFHAGQRRLVEPRPWVSVPPAGVYADPKGPRGGFGINYHARKTRCVPPDVDLIAPVSDAAAQTVAEVP